MSNGLRGMFERHFGAENVLWTIEDGTREPTGRELHAKIHAQDLARRAMARVHLLENIALVKRAIAHGCEGLTETERSLLPALLEKLEADLADPFHAEGPAPLPDPADQRLLARGAGESDGPYCRGCRADRVEEARGRAA